MARVLFVTQYYPPEAGASSNITGDIAAGLVRLGHEVTVLTCLPNYPTGVVPPEYHDKRRRDEVIDGVRVIRVWSVIRPNSGFFTRITGMLSFGMLAGFEGANKVGRQDVVIAVSPPLFTSIAARRLAKKRRAALIFNVHDLWPETAVKLGALRNRLFIWLSERLEWTTYKRARTVWVVSEGYRETLLQRGVPDSKLLVMRLGVNMDLFGRLDQSSARAALGWGDGYYALQAGTMGATQDWDSLLDAAESLREYADIHFMLAGDGAERPRLEAEVKRRELANVTFLGMQPLDRLATMISACDVSLMNFRRVPLFSEVGTLPTRMYEAMASGRPFLLTAGGVARKLAVDEARAGLYVEPGDAQALATAILRLRADPQLARELGARGRAYADATFNRTHTIAQLSAHIDALVETSGRRQGNRIASVAMTARK